MEKLIAFGRLWFQNHKATILVVWGLVIVFANDALDVYQKTGGHISKTDLQSIAIVVLVGFMRGMRDKSTTTTVATPVTTITKEVTTDDPAEDLPLNRP